MVGLSESVDNSLAGVRACVLEDHEDVRAILTEKLRGLGVEIVGEAGSLQGAEGFLATRADLALLDLRLPDGDAFELINRLARETEQKLLILSSMDDAASVLRGFRAGAHGYLVKSAEGLETGQAIKAVLRGEMPISPSIARFLLAGAPGIDVSDGIPKLSPREREILEWISRGLSRKEIARELDLSPYTVAEYSANILKKYGVPSSAAAVAKGIARGEIA